MKAPATFSFILVIGMLICFQPESVKAQDKIGDDNLGIGFMIGEPTGISVKAWNSDISAFNIGAAWSLSDRTEAVHLHADYLIHSWFEDEDLAFYYGIGARVIFADDPTAGARIPIGLNYVFQNIPFDMFAEAVPIVDFTPEIEFAGNGAVGIRYYF